MRFRSLMDAQVISRITVAVAVAVLSINIHYIQVVIYMFLLSSLYVHALIG